MHDNSQAKYKEFFLTKYEKYMANANTNTNLKTRGKEN